MPPWLIWAALLALGLLVFIAWNVAVLRDRFTTLLNKDKKPGSPDWHD